MPYSASPLKMKTLDCQSKDTCGVGDAPAVSSHTGKMNRVCVGGGGQE